MSPNIYIESLVFKHVYEYLNKHCKESEFEAENFRIDVKTIIAVSKSLIQRPNVTTPSKVCEGFKEAPHENGFRVISRFERELSLNDYRDKTRNKGGVVFEGLLPFPIRISVLPDRPTFTIWSDEYCAGESIIQALAYCPNSIESQNVLWINSELLRLLHLKIDDYHNGLRALSDDNEVVLSFRCWRDKLIGNGTSFVSTSSNLAVLEGCDLIIRDDYYLKLKSIFPELTFYSHTL